MNWFGEHLNKTLIVTMIILGVLNLIAGFMGFVISWLGAINEIIIVAVSFVFNLAVLVALSWSMYEERGIPRSDLVWLVIPSGLITLLAFLGYEIFEVIDHNNPSF